MNNIVINPKAEEWRVVADTDGLYEVSSRGRVRRIPRPYSLHARNGRPLSPRKNKAGYLSVSLHVNGRRRVRTVHRLVSEAFLSPDPGRLQINHRDGNRANNWAENLEWSTPHENTLHAHRVLNRGNGCTPSRYTVLARARASRRQTRRST